MYCCLCPVTVHHFNIIIILSWKCKSSHASKHVVFPPTSLVQIYSPHHLLISILICNILLFCPWMFPVLFLERAPLFTSSSTVITRRWRARLFDCIDMSSNIVEIGSGGGANFCYYPANSRVTCVEPVAEFNAYAQENAEK